MQIFKVEVNLNMINPTLEEAKNALSIAEQQIDAIKNIIKVIEEKGDAKTSSLGFNYYNDKDYHLKGLEDEPDFGYEEAMDFLKKEGFKSKSGKQSILSNATTLAMKEHVSRPMALNIILDIVKDEDLIDKFVNLHPDHMIWINNPCPENNSEPIRLEEMSKPMFMAKTMAKTISNPMSNGSRDEFTNPLEQLLSNAVPIAIGKGPEDLLETLKSLKKRFKKENGELDEEDLKNLADNTHAEC